MAKQTETFCKNFDKPDETRNFKAHGRLDVVNFPDGVTIGRAVFEPGWKWSNDVKPLANTEQCEAPHTGQCLSGTMVIHMKSGEEFKIHPGDVFHIPPGHDAWVEGSEEVVMLDVGGYKEYAKQKS
jgi:hypothetical protein